MRYIYNTTLSIYNCNLVISLLQKTKVELNQQKDRVLKLKLKNSQLITTNAHLMRMTQRSKRHSSRVKLKNSKLIAINARLMQMTQQSRREVKCKV